MQPAVFSTRAGEQVFLCGEEAIMRFRVELRRLCQVALATGLLAMILTTSLFARTNNMMVRPQISYITKHWEVFYYQWVNPGFSIPAREWQTPTEYLWPSLTFAEAKRTVGQRVRCAYRSDTVTGGCHVGDRGEVKDVHSVPDGGYFIVVQWETASGSRPCYYGRYSSRLFLTPE